MATTSLDTLRAALQNPNARVFLDILAQAEGTANFGQQGGYDVLFGGGTVPSLNAHPNVAVTQNVRGKPLTSTAAGRYQFLGRTWNNLQKKYGFQDFSPENQDLAALALIAEKGVLDDVLGGNFQEAGKRLGSVWASLPSSPYTNQGHLSQEQFDKLVSKASNTVGPISDTAPPRPIAAGTPMSLPLAPSIPPTRIMPSAPTYPVAPRLQLAPMQTAPGWQLPLSDPWLFPNRGTNYPSFSPLTPTLRSGFMPPMVTPGGAPGNLMPTFPGNNPMRTPNYDRDSRIALDRMMEQLDRAEQQTLNTRPVDPWPTYFDDRLLQLIDVV